MKKIIIFLFILTAGLVIYLNWPTKQVPALVEKIEKINTEVIPEEKKPIENQKAPAKIIKVKEKIIGFSQKDKDTYFQQIDDTIKEQAKELEDCENEFDLQFGEFITMGPDKLAEHLNDPRNLESFLDKISFYNFTTPSSAKMIKQLANPIASEVDGKKIIDTVGYVKTCRSQEKADLKWAFHKLKTKNPDTARAHLTFFENENSTLTYPDILYTQIWDLETFLVNYGMNEKDFPEMAQIKKDYSEHLNRLSQAEKGISGFNPKAQKENYEFAVKLQPKINRLLKKIKEKF